MNEQAYMAGYMSEKEAFMGMFPPGVAPPGMAPAMQLGSAALQKAKPFFESKVKPWLKRKLAPAVEAVRGGLQTAGTQALTALGYPSPQAVARQRQLMKWGVGGALGLGGLALLLALTRRQQPAAPPTVPPGYYQGYRQPFALRLPQGR